MRCPKTVMRPGAIEEAHVLAEDPLEMTVIEDENVIEHLRPHATQEAFDLPRSCSARARPS